MFDATSRRPDYQLGLNHQMDLATLNPSYNLGGPEASDYLRSRYAANHTT